MIDIKTKNVKYPQKTKIENLEIAILIIKIGIKRIKRKAPINDPNNINTELLYPCSM